MASNWGERESAARAELSSESQEPQQRNSLAKELSEYFLKALGNLEPSGNWGPNPVGLRSSGGLPGYGPVLSPGGCWGPGKAH